MSWSSPRQPKLSASSIFGRSGDHAQRRHIQLQQRFLLHALIGVLLADGHDLAQDLGVEPVALGFGIDFLDIVFRLEKAFGIQIPRGELFPDNILNNPEFVADGKVTDKGLAELKARMPHADFADFEQDPDVNRMPDLFTVKTIVNYVESKVK